MTHDARKVACVLTLARCAGEAPYATETYCSIEQAERSLRTPSAKWARCDIHITLIVIDPTHPEFGRPRVLQHAGDPPGDLVLTEAAEALLESMEVAHA